VTPQPGIGHNGGPSLDDSLSLAIKDACKVTGFSRDAIYELIRSREVKSFTMGHRRFILVASLREYLERRAAEPLDIRPGPNSGRLERPNG
jgi:excisionase family DNA binding protein